MPSRYLGVSEVSRSCFFTALGSAAAKALVDRVEICLSGKKTAEVSKLTLESAAQVPRTRNSAIMSADHTAIRRQLDLLDSGDTAFVIMSGVLVLMMTLPGLMLFYGTIQTLHVVGPFMQWRVLHPASCLAF